MSDDQHVGVDCAVTERRGGRVGSHPYWPHPLLVAPAELLFDGVPGRPDAGTLAAHIDLAACQTCKILNMRIRASHDGDEFGVQRQHGSQIEKRFADPRPFALVSIEVDVGLDDAELQLAGLDGVYIVDRSRRRFRRAAYAIDAQIPVDDLTDGLGYGIIDTIQFAGAD